MVLAAGKVTVRIAVDGRRLSARIARTPAPGVNRLLTGQPAEAAPRLLPVVFNLCAAAHARAANAALGRDDAGGSARTDILRDHGLAILRDWPQCLGRPPDGDGLKLLGGLLAGKDGAERALCAHILGADFSDPDAWLRRGETGTARLLADIHRRTAVCDEAAPLPPPTTAELAAAARGGPLPLREMTCGERTGMPLTGIFERLLARLVDFSLWLDSAIDEAETGPEGVGIALASRGRLAHGVVLDNRGIIADYRVVTPTDWNMRPGGLLHRLIGTIVPGDDQQTLVRLAVAATDPCVPADIVWDMGGAGHA